MKGMASLVSTAAVTAGSWLALRATLHSTNIGTTLDALLLSSWVESSKETRSEEIGKVARGIVKGQMNTSDYCRFSRAEDAKATLANVNVEQNEVMEVLRLNNLCDVWKDGAANHYKAIKLSNCPFWLHERDGQTKQSASITKASAGNVVMVKIAETSSKTSKYNQIEGRWRVKSTDYIEKKAQNIMKGVGNQLSDLYMIKYAASVLGIPVVNGCVDMDGPRDSRNGTIQSLLPAYDDVTSLKDDAIPTKMQDICTLGLDYKRFPHTCPHCLSKVTSSICRDMRSVAHQWACENKDADLDEATIHVRCGDIIRGGVSEYGFIPYRVYTQIIPRTAKSIGIITSTFDKDQCRSNDCAAVGNCRGLIMDIQSFLQDEYPFSKITIRNGPEETLVSAFARIVLSRRTVCSPSTFCLFPAIATVGEGYFTNSELYPFVREVAAQPKSNIRVIEEDFLSTSKMRALNISTIDGLTEHLRRPQIK